jgi:hypothetical protein
MIDLTVESFHCTTGISKLKFFVIMKIELEVTTTILLCNEKLDPSNSLDVETTT